MSSNQDISFQTKRKYRELFFLLLIIIYSCSGNKEKQPENKLPSGSNVVSQAERFRLDKKKDYTKVTILNPWQGAKGVNLEYNLVRRGSKLPDGLDSSMVIFVPLRKIICMSTTHIAMISALGEENSISGMSGPGFIFSESLRRKVEKGLIEDVGYEANMNRELILKINPDAIMMYGIGSESTGYVGKIKELGIKVFFNADYLETDPLRKAEWIKLFGALYCKEYLADSIFRSEVESYNSLKLYIGRNVTDKPKVLLGLPFKDTWFVSPGNSFISKLIGDAGGNYLWQDTRSSVSMPFGIENVYLKALDTDYWLNIGNVNTKTDISSVDQRLQELPCFKKGNLYNNNKRTAPNGGNDFWESGTVYPHRILKDIATILHPDLFSGNELFYYLKIN
jgi:iron complex transport system substrate-binding protein